MNASSFMDKQIMDLSRSNPNPNPNSNSNPDHNPKIPTNNNHNDFLDLMNPQSEEDTDAGSLNNKDEILANYDFHPISRSNLGVHSSDESARVWNSVDSKSKSTPLRSYSSVDPAESDKMVPDKGQKVNDSAILSEIDQMMKKYTDSLLHAIDSLSARLSQLETRARNLEYSVDDLKVSVGNNLGNSDGKIRHLENILLEVQSGVQDIKDKQDVMEGHMHLAKLQLPKVEKSSEPANAEQQLPQASAPSQLPNLQPLPPAGVPQQPLPSLSPIVPPPPQQTIHPSPPVTSQQFPPNPNPIGPNRDPYYSPPSQQAQDAPVQPPYQMPPPTQLQQHSPAPTLASQPQQYPPTPTPPYPQPPPPPVAAPNAPSQFQPSSLGQHPEEYMPPPNYPPPNRRQPTSQPSSIPPQSHQYYGSPSPMYEPPPPSRSNSGFPNYGPTSGGPNEPFPYGGSPSQYGSGPLKQPPNSPGRGGAATMGNYPQLPNARILPQAIPTAGAVSGGGSSGGGGSGSGNRVPIDDVIDKVTTMGFPREHVRGTVRRLTENGQAVDLNIVLDKLMNDGDVPPQRSWFGQ